MRSPKDMEVIQIEITNACAHNCSNCTRFCGLHKEPFFMDFETFKKAVDSLKDFKGAIGIMGGEPTLHPEFEKFMEYFKSQIPEVRPAAYIDFPTPSYREYVQGLKYRRGRKRGLWSSMGPQYYKHFELIQDVFAYQVLNDHSHPNEHQGILIPREELNIPDDEWIKQRDKCWIQNLWSASITPKGAFFCEIAAAMDMLFDGPGGWDINSNWWERKPEYFKDQLHWCEKCSVALNVPSILATEETDLISKGMEEKLLEIGGKKMKTKHYKVFDAKEYNKNKRHRYKPTWYLPGGSESYRVSSSLSSLYPKKIDVVILQGESEKATISKAQLESLDFEDFVIVFPSQKEFDEKIIEKMKKCVFNPGYFYKSKKNIWIFNRRAKALRGKESISGDKNLYKLWVKDKVSVICMKKLGKLTLLQKFKHLCYRIAHRGTFLIPDFMLKGKYERVD